MKTVTVMYGGKNDPGIIQQLGRALRHGDLVEVNQDKIAELSAESFVIVLRPALVDWAKKHGEPLARPEAKPEAGKGQPPKPRTR